MAVLRGFALAAGFVTTGADPEAGSVWAVIAAGSSGIGNYRHQADACHSYQVLRESGVPASQIILMMQDDVANDEENPFKGKLFNKPGSGVDVYKGCKIDYRGSMVTAELFLQVITGDKNVPQGGTGRVLESKASDRVFLNFIDHGAAGIVAFPNGPPLHVAELSKALETMKRKQLFKELVFYMEACESGSMFPHLTSDGKIFAVSAANATESSWATYCPPNDTVDGKEMGTCLGDMFSVAWTEDADRGRFRSETIKKQVAIVTARTNESHVMTFGDKSVEAAVIGNFEFLGKSEESASPHKDPGHQFPKATSYDVRDVPLHVAYWRWVRAQPEAKGEAWDKLQAIVADRYADQELFKEISRSPCGELIGCAEQLLYARMALKDLTCHQNLVRIIHEECPNRRGVHPGGWNSFNMKFSQVLVNMCESKESLKKDDNELAALVRAECSAAQLRASDAKPADLLV